MKGDERTDTQTLMIILLVGYGLIWMPCVTMLTFAILDTRDQRKREKKKERIEVLVNTSDSSSHRLTKHS